MQIGSVSLEQNSYLILNISSNEESKFKFLLKNQKDNEIHLINDKYENNGNSVKINIDTIKALKFGTYELGLWLSETNYRRISYEGELLVNLLLSKDDLLSVELSLSDNKTILLNIKPNITFYFKQCDLNDSICKGYIDSDNTNIFNLNIKPAIVFKHRTHSNSYNKYSDVFVKSINLNENVSININELFNEDPKTEIIDTFVRVETQTDFHDYPLNFAKKDLILNNKYHCSNKLFLKFKPFTTVHNTLAFIKRKLDLEVYLSEIQELNDSLKFTGAIISEDIKISEVNRIKLILKPKYGTERIVNANINGGIFNIDLDYSSINMLEQNQQWKLYMRIYNKFENTIDLPISIFYLNKKHFKKKYRISNYSFSLNENNNKTLIFLEKNDFCDPLEVER
ncbi:hypothetical protein MOC70_05500 [Bacillus vallismortis]|uniref:hypothetical protein n=1 Tax=Bacillus vallismortis TaxID=72361 RepID=UPI00227F46D8|nr:hypothetical protein [Bacillus vallismortis]MCY8424088.1 hypothetical protein [Bacillus vallismortis]